MPPTIFVISLLTAQKRRAFMKAQLNAQGIAFEFFDAVHGASNPDHPLFSKYDDKERLRRRGPGTSLNAGQLGCFASHYLLWEHCVASGKPIIVLEDDVQLLQPEFSNFYKSAHDFAANFGLVWMQPNLRGPQRDIHLGQWNGFSVKKLIRGASGTLGYLISPASAKALLDYCQTWIYPVDATMKRFFEHGVEAFGIEPACVHSQDGLGSYVNEARQSVRRTLWQKARREWFTIIDKRRRWKHNTQFRLKARREEQHPDTESYGYR